MKYIDLAALAVFALSFIVLSGCNKDDNPSGPGPTGGSTEYVGTLVGATVSGTLSLSIPTAKTTVPTSDTVNVTGKIFLSAGDTITLSGIYVKSTGYISVSGSGYSLIGTISSGRLNGSFTGPLGSSGSFAARSSSSGGTIKVFCGSYTETSPGTSHGVINVVVDGNAVTVIVSGLGTYYYGTISGTTVTIYLAGTSGTELATGTISGSSISGTYSNGEYHGTWTATLCH